jgi:flagellar biosynthesis protein FlhB
MDALEIFTIIYMSIIIWGVFSAILFAALNFYMSRRDFNLKLKLSHHDVENPKPKDL